MQEIEAALRVMIVEDLGWSGDPELLTDDLDLIANDVIDSLAIIRLVGFIEDRWGCEIPDADLVADNFTTLGAMTKLVSSLSTG